jgi:hypothetical protein
MERSVDDLSILARHAAGERRTLQESRVICRKFWNYSFPKLIGFRQNCKAGFDSKHYLQHVIRRRVSVLIFGTLCILCSL